MTNLCPACGYVGLAEPPWTPEGGSSYEICPSCGFEFGVTDEDLGFTYEAWRSHWIASGAGWADLDLQPPPADWNPRSQLRNLRSEAERIPGINAPTLEMDGLASNEIVARTLSAAGWNRHRWVDTEGWRRWYARNGFVESARVLAILRSFGSLLIEPPRHADATFFSGSIRFEPDKPWSGERDGVADREKRLGHRLWPIAEWSDMYMVLYADNGAVYADGGNLGVLLIGDTFVEALTLIITAERKPLTVVE